MYPLAQHTLRQQHGDSKKRGQCHLNDIRREDSYAGEIRIPLPAKTATILRFALQADCPNCTVEIAASGVETVDLIDDRAAGGIVEGCGRDGAQDSDEIVVGKGVVVVGFGVYFADGQVCGE